MLDGNHDQLDFDFEIDGQKFDHLYYLVDGIHPALSWFPQLLIAFLLPSKKVGGKQLRELLVSGKRSVSLLVPKLCYKSVKTFLSGHYHNSYAQHDG